MNQTDKLRVQPLETGQDFCSTKSVEYKSCLSQSPSFRVDLRGVPSCGTVKSGYQTRKGGFVDPSLGTLLIDYGTISSASKVPLLR